MKRIISLFTAFVLCFLCLMPTNAVSIDKGIDELRGGFVPGKGPETGGYIIDYSYYSPVKASDNGKYPLVIWLHGMGDGAEVGKPAVASNIAYWTSDEFQSRFSDAGGAFIFAPRSLEEKGIFWSNYLIEPLKAAIDDFIGKNKKNIDLSRIYIGGYSMGGKMTYKMAIAFPEMFAAAFPICPAWSPTEDLLEKIADMPVWVISSTRDPLVNYYFAVTPTWENLISVSNVAENCRLSTLTRVCYEDGKNTSSNHHAWFAVNHDMFSSSNGDYPNMTTVNGKGEDVKLTYPDGIISWLSQHTSDYDGAPTTGTGNIDIESVNDRIIAADGIFDFFSLLFEAIVKVFSF